MSKPVAKDRDEAEALVIDALRADNRRLLTAGKAHLLIRPSKRLLPPATALTRVSRAWKT
jgi:hypothetical protein